MTDDEKLVYDLVQAAYESGYYSGKGEDGQPHHMAAMEERKKMHDKVLQRLAAAPDLLAALEVLFTVLAHVDTVYETETGHTIEQDFAEELDQARAALSRTSDFGGLMEPDIDTPFDGWP